MYVCMWLLIAHKLSNTGRRDNSGMIFTYTSRRRQHDAGILSMGHLVTQGQIIPPNADSYTTYGVCPSGCTQVSDVVELDLLNRHVAWKKCIFFLKFGFDGQLMMLTACTSLAPHMHVHVKFVDI